MSISLLQLNILGGKLIKEIRAFVREYEFDILNFQEVAGGKMSAHHTDCFKEFQSALKEYRGELVKTWNLTGDPSSYFGNATFYKRSFSVKTKEIIWLQPHREIPDHNQRNIPDDPRSALSICLRISGNDLQIINTHLAWGPTPHDETYKIKQGNILFNHVKNLPRPFILTGDFNLTPDSQIVRKFGTLGRNLTKEHRITNTLNPHVHWAKHLFPPGLAVDYAFVHPALAVTKFQLLKTPDLSDHFGLALEIKC